MIAEAKPRWVIRTGTGGGIGDDTQVGDVLVSQRATFDCEIERRNGDGYECAAPAPAGDFATAESLFSANAGFLPATNDHPPQVAPAASAQTGALATDFFGFEDTTNYYGLQGHGGLSEMGDAVLGLVCSSLGNETARYSFVRNVSDPRIAADDLTIEAQKKVAADIYEAHGRWSTVCSALTRRVIIADLN
jgi:hypothetical protein